MPLSIVIPCYDEAATLTELTRQLHLVLATTTQPYEIIFVDDGSRDNSAEILHHLAAEDERVRVIRLRTNRGKAVALMLGFAAAQGDIVVTMDADLQDDPQEIPRFLTTLAEGCDVVTGWKEDRHDPLDKTLPSRLFNRVLRWASGLNVHDFNCGFKAYRQWVVKHLCIQGTLHRYVLVMAQNMGARIGEIPVRHHARVAGHSKYGWTRMLHGMFDLLTALLLTKYITRPLHLFGALGMATGSIGALILIGLCTGHAVYLVSGNAAYELRERPLLIIGVLLLLGGAQAVSTGLIAEMLSYRTAPADLEAYVAERLGFHT